MNRSSDSDAPELPQGNPAAFEGVPVNDGLVLPEGFAIERVAPHVYVQRFPGRTSDDDLAVFLEALEATVRTLERPYTWLIDLRRLVSSTSTQRRIYAEFDRRVADHDRAHCAGVALVFSNPLTRGMVTAVHWITPPVYPHRTTSTVAQGVRWLCAQLESRGVSLPVELTLAQAEACIERLDGVTGTKERRRSPDAASATTPPRPPSKT